MAKADGVYKATINQSALRGFSQMAYRTLIVRAGVEFGESHSSATEDLEEALYLCLKNNSTDF